MRLVRTFIYIPLDFSPCFPDFVVFPVLLVFMETANSGEQQRKTLK